MNVIVHIDGAIVEELERGVAAAQAVFDSPTATKPRTAQSLLLCLPRDIESLRWGNRVVLALL